METTKFIIIKIKQKIVRAKAIWLMPLGWVHDQVSVWTWVVRVMITTDSFMTFGRGGLRL